MRGAFLIMSTGLALVAGGLAWAQEAVVAAPNVDALFTSKDPHLNRIKQATWHIEHDLLLNGHWDQADKWLTPRYVQHNPNYASGRAAIVAAFGKRPHPATEQPLSGIVAVVAEGDYVTVISVSHRPDPANPGATYATSHFDTWRFVDGKADEHWDEGQKGAPIVGNPLLLESQKTGG